MKNFELSYLEHGKFFIENRFPSDFNELAYTSGLNEYSKNLRDALGLNLRTDFSKIPGNVSFAFFPVFGKTHYAFVQFQSRFENEFFSSSTNRPFFQTKFLLAKVEDWRNCFEEGLSVFPSLVEFDASENTKQLPDYSTVKGDVGKTISVSLFDSGSNNDFFFKRGRGNTGIQLTLLCDIGESLIGPGDLNLQIPFFGNDRERLEFADALLRTSLPITKFPVSFSFNSACTSNVNIRFAEFTSNVETNKTLQVRDPNRLSGEFQEYVNLFYENTSRWLDFSKRIYSGYSTVNQIRKDGRVRDAFLLILSNERNNFYHLFVSTNGQLDLAIVTHLTDTEVKRIIIGDQQGLKTRLFIGLSEIHTPAENWFRLLLRSKIPASNVYSLVFSYILSNPSQFILICEIFGELSKHESEFFEMDHRVNVLYNAIKRYFIQSGADTDLLKKNIISDKARGEKSILHSIVKGLPKLPESYTFSTELLDWIRPYFQQLVIIFGSLTHLFHDLGIDIEHQPALFLESINEVGLTINDLSEIDQNTYRTILKRQVIRDKNDRVEKPVSVSPPPSVPPLPNEGIESNKPIILSEGSIYILDKAKEERDQQGSSDNSLYMSTNLANNRPDPRYLPPPNSVRDPYHRKIEHSKRPRTKLSCSLIIYMVVIIASFFSCMLSSFFPNLFHLLFPK